MKIYVASLSDYNAGVLHGEWVEVTTKEEIQEAIASMLADSPTAKQEGVRAEEFAIHDYDGFGPLKLSEHEDLDDLVVIGEAYEEHGEPFLAWAASDDGNRDAERFVEVYQGSWPSLEDYVEHLWEESGDTPQAPDGQWWHPANYVDWERMANDLELNGDVWTAEHSGGVYVFDNH